MIKVVTVTNYLGDSIRLELARPGLSGFVVESITGLGPVKADINTTEVSTNDGALYNSARLSKRNIVIAIKYYFGGEETIEELRHKSYKYFPVKKKIKLVFETDERLVETEGYVESNDTVIFSKTEGSDISIICPDPYFYLSGNNGTQTTIFYSIEPMFEFPFSNESLTEDLLIMGDIKNKSENYLVYEGDAETGIIMSIHAVGPVDMIAIYNLGTRETMFIDTLKIETTTGAGFDYGDDIIICTIKGKKSVTLLRNGLPINILNCIDKTSDWFQISKGVNVFAFDAVSGVEYLQFTIENKVRYEGV
jgi:hypothetical protein